MFNIALFLLGFCLLLFMIGVLFGEHWLAKMMFLNAATSTGIILISLLGSLKYSYGFIDIALIYALLGFIANIAILRYVNRMNIRKTGNKE